MTSCWWVQKAGRAYGAVRSYAVRASPRSLVGRLRWSRLPLIKSGRNQRAVPETVERLNEVKVRIRDDPNGVLRRTPALLDILGNSALVIERKMEMMNVFFGFEQANKYVVMDPSGKHVGYIAETGEQSLSKMLARQVFRTHRSFKAHVLDRDGKEVLLIERPFSWINSTIRVLDRTDGTSLVVGEVQQQWNVWRRKYNLFLKRNNDFFQFAFIDEPMFSWDFLLMNQEGECIGSVNRNFMGLLREMFTDTGNYVLRMDAVSSAMQHAPSSYNKQLVHTEEKMNLVPSSSKGLTLDERAVILATAISIDFDYFSKASKGSVGISPFFPIWFPVFGGGGHQNSNEHPDSSSVPEDQDKHETSNEASKSEETTEKNWWELPPDNNVWGEGDHDPWNDSNQDNENNNSSWTDFFEEDD